MAPLGGRCDRSRVDDIISQIGAVIDASHHHVRFRAHQLVDRQMHAVGRRALHRIVAAFVDAGDPQRYFQRQRVTRAAAVAIRRHHNDLTTRAQRLAEGTNALGMHTIIITDQNSHRSDS